MKNSFFIDFLKFSSGAILGLSLVYIIFGTEDYSLASRAFFFNIIIGTVLGFCLAKYNQQ